MSDVTWLCLAAGQGSRLRPITDDKPKAMVSVADRPLIDWLLDTARAVGIDDMAVVGGYLSETLAAHLPDSVTVYENPEYESTDMVRSLWCGRDALDGTVVISYSDILYTPGVLRSVIESPRDVAVTVDDRWRPYWQRRHEEPVEDAESLRLAADDRIEAIGGAVSSLSAPAAQYVGLIKLSPDGVEALRATYRAAERASADGEALFGRDRPLETLHMTDLLQWMIDRDVAVHAHRIEGNWVEIDTPRDLDIARDVCKPAGDGTLTIHRGGEK